MKHISIAIDGPSGAGKSTLARKIAKRFGFLPFTVPSPCTRSDPKSISRTVPLCWTR